MNILSISFEYIMVFVIILAINYFLFIRKKTKYNKNKVPMELYYLTTMYKVDVSKINYKQFVWLYSIINTFIVDTIYIIVIYLVDGLLLQLVVGIVLLILLIIICYGLLGRHYERNGK